MSEANDSCRQQNPAEVQQNSSKWGQRIGWTVSKSTQVRWGTELVHPMGLTVIVTVVHGGSSR